MVLVAGAGAGVAGFLWHCRQAEARFQRELDAQRDLITATIDDVLDEIWVFTGSEAARRTLVDRMLARTESMLALRPEDAGLLEAKARLLRAMGYLYEDQSDAGALARACQGAMEIYDRLSAERGGDVEFVRAHAESVVRVGNAVDFAGPRSVHHDRIRSYYQRALDLQLGAQSSWPDHPGLQDDICWSYARLIDFVPYDHQWGVLMRQVACAERLCAQEPGRLLSLLALQDAHWRVGVFLSQPGSMRDAARAREHLLKALEIARGLVRAQPDRGGFVSARGLAIKSLMELHRAEGNTAELEALATELEGTLADPASPSLQRKDVQYHMIRSCNELVLTYQMLGRHEDARAAAERLLRMSSDDTLVIVPRARHDLDRAVERIAAMRVMRPQQE